MPGKEAAVACVDVSSAYPLCPLFTHPMLCCFIFSCYSPPSTSFGRPSPKDPRSDRIPLHFTRTPCLCAIPFILFNNGLSLLPLSVSTTRPSRLLHHRRRNYDVRDPRQGPLRQIPARRARGGQLEASSARERGCPPASIKASTFSYSLSSVREYNNGGDVSESMEVTTGEVLERKASLSLARLCIC